MFVPVRLGFPRETLDGASYMGHRIPRDTVRVLTGCVVLHLDILNSACSARHHEPIRW